MSRIIHRIFFNFDNGPDPFLPYLETWMRDLPDFEIMQWDKTNLPLDLNEYTRQLAAEKNHAFLSDYFRCWLLEKYGGVYLDADIEVLDGNAFRTIYDEAQQSGEYSLFIGIESASNGKLTAHSMGVRDGTFHPMLRFLMNLYEREFSGPLHHVIKKFDMPSLMSLYFINKDAGKASSMHVNGTFRGNREPLIFDEIKIYPSVYFSPLTKRVNTMTVTSFGPETCMCHHFAATWKSTDTDSKTAKCFDEAIRDGDYAVMPSLARTLKALRPSVGKHFMRPLWKLKDNQIHTIEIALNRLIPYGSTFFRLLKK